MNLKSRWPQQQQQQQRKQHLLGRKKESLDGTLCFNCTCNETACLCTRCDASNRLSACTRYANGTVLR